MIFLTVEAVDPHEDTSSVLYQGDLDAGQVLKCFAQIAAVCLPSADRRASQWMVVSSMDTDRIVIDAPVITTSGLGLGEFPPGPAQFRYIMVRGRVADDLSLFAIMVRGMCRAYPGLCSSEVSRWLEHNTWL